MSHWSKPNAVTVAARLVAERYRQIEKGFTPEHDDEHKGGSIARAAACYVADERIYIKRDNASGTYFIDPWPWEGGDARKRPLRSNYPTPELVEGDDRIRMLEKAGAMIIAEIERLERLKPVQSKKEYFDAAATKVKAVYLEHGERVLRESAATLEDMRKSIPIRRPPIGVPNDHPQGAPEASLVDPNPTKILGVPQGTDEAILGTIKEAHQIVERLGQNVLGLCSVCKGKKVSERGFDGDVHHGAGRPIMGPCLHCGATGKEPTE